MQGPRQGVHLSPQHMQQWRQLHRFVQWRKFQFRDPDDTYVYRARIEPRPPQLPTPPAEPKQHNAAFPSRSHLLKRPSSSSASASACSSSGNSRPRSATPTSPSHQPPRPIRATSTTTLCSSTPNRQAQSSNKQTSLGGQATVAGSSRGQLSGSEFTLSATAMSIQPRQPSQRSLASGKTNKQLVVNSASFPYPDPTKVKGDPRFLSRLGELTRLEAETIRSEQAKARLLLSARSRPASAKSLKSSAAVSASSANGSKSNYYTSHQSSRCVSMTSGTTKGVKRLNSSPAVSAYNRSSTSNASSSLAISKQLSCTEFPTRTQARRIDDELDSVKETTSKLSVTVSNCSLGVAEDESKVQRSSTCPDIDVAVVEEGLGDGSKDQRSCSPPIIRIPAPPFKCSWSIGEGEGDSTEKHEVGRREKIDGPGREGDGERKNSTTNDDTAKESPASLNQGDVASCQNGHTPPSPGDHCDRAVVEDDLKVTSDLGLSIDSLHLSEEDNNPEPAAVSNIEHPDQTGVDLNTKSNALNIGSGVENGSSEGYGDSVLLSAKTPTPNNDKLTEYELDIDTVSESGSTTKRSKRRVGKKSNKLSNGTSAMMQLQGIDTSSSSTNLKGSKTVRNSHKTVKKSTKRHTRK